MSKRIYENIGVVDMRSTTPESLEEVTALRNVATVIFSQRTAGLLSQLTIENAGPIVEVPEDALVVGADTSFDAAFFKASAPGRRFLVTGQLELADDVHAVLLETSAAEFYLAAGSQVRCAPAVASVFKAHARLLDGAVVARAAKEGAGSGEGQRDSGSEKGEPEVYKINGKDRINAAMLSSWTVPRTIVVNGSASVDENLPADLVDAKIVSVKVNGVLRVPEGQSALLAKIGKVNGKVFQVPSEFAMFEGDLLLDAATIASFRARGQRGIACSGNVRVAEGLEAEALAQTFDSIHVGGLFVCPARLKAEAAALLAPGVEKAFFHAHPLWFLEGNASLGPARFELTEGTVSLVVADTLEIEEVVAHTKLYARVAEFFNLGEVTCSFAQKDALLLRAAPGGTGAFTLAGRGESNVTRNLAYLRL